MALYDSHKFSQEKTTVQLSMEPQYCDVENLARLIGLSLELTRQVAKRAGARIRVSDKRFVYSIKCVYDYLERLRVEQIEAEADQDVIDDADQAEA